MKTLIGVFAIALVLTTSAVHAGDRPKKESIEVLSIEHEIFYFKTSKNFLGAQIEVYNSDNRLLRTERVFDRRMIIDFYDLPSGSYGIKIKKDNMTIEYRFIKV